MSTSCALGVIRTVPGARRILPFKGKCSGGANSIREKLGGGGSSTAYEWGESNQHGKFIVWGKNLQTVMPVSHQGPTCALPMYSAGYQPQLSQKETRRLKVHRVFKRVLSEAPANFPRSGKSFAAGPGTSWQAPKHATADAGGTLSPVCTKLRGSQALTRAPASHTSHFGIFSLLRPAEPRAASPELHQPACGNGF